MVPHHRASMRRGGGVILWGWRYRLTKTKTLKFTLKNATQVIYRHIYNDFPRPYSTLRTEIQDIVIN